MPEGLLVGTLVGGWFKDGASNQHTLLNIPEASCTSLTFERQSRLCLLSQRPGRVRPVATHTIMKLIGSDTNTPYHCNVKQFAMVEINQHFLADP